MKTIYMMRHSEALKLENIENSDSLQLQNEKFPLTIEGEKLAKEMSEKEEFQNFDIVISSSYVRAISTAKYFAKDKIKIIESFGERKFGINSWNELPEGFGEQQFIDFNYKMPNGESLNEVIEREYKALINILNNMNNEKILIVGHSTAMASLFSKWCDLTPTSYKFNGQEYFNGAWRHCETFRLDFNDNNELIGIKNVER